MLARIKFELAPLVNEMLDHLPESVWTSKDSVFLDPSMGGGQFVREVERRLQEYGHSVQNIQGRVLGLEKYPHQIQYAVSKHKLTGDYAVANFIDEKFDNMKIDVIVGNPPFQRSDNKAKRWTLWEQFVARSLTLADHVAMVVPQSLTSPGATFDSVKQHCHVLNVDVGRHFNVGSTFCYFVAEPKQTVTQTRIITDRAEFARDISQAPFLPITIDDAAFAQFDQLMARTRRTWRRGELHTSNEHLFNNNGQYSVMHTNAQELRTDAEHPNRTKIRVAVSLSGYPQFRVLHNEYASQACFWTEFATKDQADVFAAECNGPAIQSILTNFKWSGWNSKEVIACL